jgi:hypothetical protein
MEPDMAKKVIKNGDKSIVVDGYGDLTYELRNRVINEEAGFACKIILQTSANNSGMKPGAVVEHAFEVARLTFEHIKANKMDTPFPFKKVFGDDQNG